MTDHGMSEILGKMHQSKNLWVSCFNSNSFSFYLYFFPFISILHFEAVVLLVYVEFLWFDTIVVQYNWAAPLWKEFSSCQPFLVIIYIYI